MGFIKKLAGAFSGGANVKQSRALAAKLNDTHVKYACVKDGGEDKIIGRDGHLNITADGVFELTFGVESVFRFKIDEMSIWEFMSLDGATVSGKDLNSGEEKAFIVYYEKRLS